MKSMHQKHSDMTGICAPMKMKRNSIMLLKQKSNELMGELFSVENSRDTDCKVINVSSNGTSVKKVLQMPPALNGRLDQKQSNKAEIKSCSRHLYQKYGHSDKISKLRQTIKTERNAKSRSSKLVKELRGNKFNLSTTSKTNLVKKITHGLSKSRMGDTVNLKLLDTCNLDGLENIKISPRNRKILLKKSFVKLEKLNPRDYHPQEKVLGKNADDLLGNIKTGVEKYLPFKTIHEKCSNSSSLKSVFLFKKCSDLKLQDGYDSIISEPINCNDKYSDIKLLETVAVYDTQLETKPGYINQFEDISDSSSLESVDLYNTCSKLLSETLCEKETDAKLPQLPGYISQFEDISDSSSLESVDLYHTCSKSLSKTLCEKETDAKLSQLEDHYENISDASTLESVNIYDNCISPEPFKSFDNGMDVRSFKSLAYPDIKSKDSIKSESPETELLRKCSDLDSHDDHGVLLRSSPNSDHVSMRSDRHFLDIFSDISEPEDEAECEDVMQNERLIDSTAKTDHTKVEKEITQSKHEDSVLSVSYDNNIDNTLFIPNGDDAIKNQIGDDNFFVENDSKELDYHNDLTFLEDKYVNVPNKSFFSECNDVMKDNVLPGAIVGCDNNEMENVNKITLSEENNYGVLKMINNTEKSKFISHLKNAGQDGRLDDISVVQSDTDMEIGKYEETAITRSHNKDSACIVTNENDNENSLYMPENTKNKAKFTLDKIVAITDQSNFTAGDLDLPDLTEDFCDKNYQAHTQYDAISNIRSVCDVHLPHVDTHLFSREHEAAIVCDNKTVDKKFNTVSSFTLPEASSVTVSSQKPVSESPKLLARPELVASKSCPLTAFDNLLKDNSESGRDLTKPLMTSSLLKRKIRICHSEIVTQSRNVVGSLLHPNVNGKPQLYDDPVDQSSIYLSTFLRLDQSYMFYRLSDSHANMFGCTEDDDGNLGLGAALPLFQSFTSDYVIPREIVTLLINSAFFCPRWDLRHVYLSFKMLKVQALNDVDMFEVEWDKIEHCLKTIICSNETTCYKELLQASLYLQLILDVLKIDLYSRDISDSAQIRKSWAYKLFAYEVTSTKRRELLFYLKQSFNIDQHCKVHVDGEDVNIPRILHVLQDMIALCVDVSSSCLDSASYVAADMLTTYKFLLNLTSKETFLNSVHSSILLYKLVQKILEFQYHNNLCLGGFPDSLMDVVLCFFQVEILRNPRTIPPTDDEYHCLQAEIAEIAMLLYYIVLSYLQASKDKSYIALRRRTVDKIKKREIGTEDMATLEKHIDDLEKRLKDLTPELPVMAQNYIELLRFII